MKKFIAMLFLITAVFAFGLTAHAEVPQKVDKAVALATDTVWTGDFYVTEDIDLKGFALTVEGNLILGDESININGGKLIVKGDFRIQAIKRDSKDSDYKVLASEEFQGCKGVLKMDQDNDYVLVEGDFYPNGDDNTLRNGTVELKGDFMYVNGSYSGAYDAIGKHKTIFSGEGDQKIFFRYGGSQFNIFKVKKSSGKLIFESPVQIASIDEDTDIPVGGKGYLNLDLDSKTGMNLNGHKLNIDGSLILSDGILNINNGQLIVRKDFRIQSIDSKTEDSGAAYYELKNEDFSICKGTLQMDNDKDYVLVEGDFYPNGSDNTLRNGVVELKGDLMYMNGGYIGGYDAIGKHKTLFSGAGDQRVFFTRSGSQFNILGVNKKSGKMIFESTVDIASIDEDTTIPVGGNGYMYLYLYTNKNFSLKGHKLTIDGTLFMERGSMDIAGGNLVVTKDLRVEQIKDLSKKIKLNLSQLSKEDFGRTSNDTQLVMKNAKDYVLVKGSFIICNYDDIKNLRSGILEVKGDFIQKASTSMFVAYDSHKVILSGEKKQVVSFNSPSYKDNKTGKITAYNHFNILHIKNKDVVFTTTYKVAPYRSIYWQNKLIPFVLNVNLNEKAVKFAKYSPIIINGVIYFEIGETNKLLGTKLVYNTKASAVSGKYGSKNLSVIGTTSNKVNYIQAEALLKQMGVKYNYDPRTQTLYIKK